MTENNVSSGDENVAEFISKAGNERVEDTVKTFSHKYKWTGEEKGITIAVLAGAVTMIVLGFMGISEWVPALITAGVLLLGVGALIYLGESRKRKSRLIATYHPASGELAVEGFKYKANENHGTLHGIRHVFVKDARPYNILMISCTNNKKALEVPLRLAAAPGLNEILRSAVIEDTNFAAKDPEITEFFEKAKTFKK